MRNLSKFFKDITKSVGSSGIQFAITLFSTPIMTRLYSPSDYATFGIITSAATSIIGIGLLSLPNAYILEKQPSARQELLHTMLYLMVILILFSTVLAVGFAAADIFHVGMHISGIVLILFPLLVFAYGIRQILTNIAVHRVQFNSTALGRVIDPICSRGGAIGFAALFGAHPAFVVISAIGGHLVAAIIIVRIFTRRTLREWKGQLKLSHTPLSTLRRYSDFAIYSTLSIQAQSLALLGIQIGIAAFFSSAAAGYYIFATSILSLPLTLIALTTSTVVYRQMIEIADTAPEKLLSYLMKAASMYAAIGIGILLPILFFGEEIFRFAFGVNWAEAGRVASILSIAYMALFVTIGVQSIFRITKRLKLQFWLEIFTNLVNIFVAIVCIYNMSFMTAIYAIAATMFLRNCVIVSACILVAYQYNKKYTAVS